MTDRADRFQERKKRREESQKRSHLHQVADPELVQKLMEATASDALRVELDNERNACYAIDLNPAVSIEEAIACLAEARKDFDQQKIAKLVNSAKKSVAESIAIPFGLGAVVHTLDRDGGTVTTIHNARQGIYAQDKDIYSNKKGDYAFVKGGAGPKFSGGVLRVKR